MPDEAFNPFRYSSPVDAADLVDRDEEATTLRTLAEGGHNSRLVAPRRYGKTSLLNRVVEDAIGQGLNAVLVDFYGVTRQADVALRMDQAYRRLKGPIARTADRLLLDARLRAGLGPANVEVEIRSRESGERLLLELLDVPQRAAERTGRRTLVVFDEFQDILRVGEGLDATLRSRIQHQAEHASYIFSGSHPGMLAALFDRRERPLFGQARAIRLPPLAERDIAGFVGARFEQSGREPGRALEYLLRAAHGHPQRAMMLAHHLWSQTGPRGTADEATWHAAEAAVYDELREALGLAWEGLDEESDRRLLTAIASGERTVFAQATLDRYGLTKGSATRARDRLLAGGDLEDRDGRLAVVDPLFAAWIAAGRRSPVSSAATED